MKGKLAIGLIFLLASCLNDNTTSTQVQLNKDIKEIDQYLADIGATNVIKDASGIRIVIHNLGDGISPNLENDLEIDYTGRLLSSGAIFDEGTWLQSAGETIVGWQIGLPMLPEGTSATLYIPSVYAYGRQGQQGGAVPIPGNANLIFDVEVVDVLMTAAQQTKLNSDINAINTYLGLEGITAEVHSSGLRYVIVEPGDGPTPGQFDQVVVNYTGKLIPNETQFESGTVSPSAAFSSRVANFINGWQIGLQLIQEGGKINVYIPSGLAYGTRANVSIPANSNLIFEIELVEVVE
jgi:FKBP-type peptidyl-prolyl cis-trans isomerase FkpA